MRRLLVCLLALFPVMAVDAADAPPTAPKTALVIHGGAGFVPISDRSEMELLVETPPGSSLGYTRRKVEAGGALVRAGSEARQG